MDMIEWEEPAHGRAQFDRRAAVITTRQDYVADILSHMLYLPRRPLSDQIPPDDLSPRATPGRKRREEKLHPILKDFFTSEGNKVAIVFVHGFTGDVEGTWGDIPQFLHQQPELAGWDLVGFGYQSKRRFDIVNLWSADASLEEISTKLDTALDWLRATRGSSSSRTAWAASSFSGRW